MTAPSKIDQQTAGKARTGSGITAESFVFSIHAQGRRGGLTVCISTVKQLKKASRIPVGIIKEQFTAGEWKVLYPLLPQLRITGSCFGYEFYPDPDFDTPTLDELRERLVKRGLIHNPYFQKEMEYCQRS